VAKLAAAAVPIGLGTDSGTTHRFPGYFEHRESSSWWKPA
jgi:hypothetical protein